MLSRSKIIIYLLILGGIFIYPNFVFGATNSLVINEVQIDSVDGDGGASDDFIELYNPTDSDIYLGNYQESYLRLVKRTKTGTLDASIKSWNGDSEAKVPAYGFYLWSNSDYTGINTTPDATTASIISADNGIALRLGPMDTGLIIDSLGWGECQNEFVEGSTATDLLGGQSLERQPIGQDSNNNSIDFVIQNTPTPQNSGGQEIPPGETPAQEESDGTDWTPPTVVNNPPIAKAGTDITALVNQEISFDGSQSSDQDYDTLTYFWNFGDGATDTEKISTHIYTYPGQYIVSLLVNDGELSNLDVITVNVYAESIIISEFNNEWIELYNQSDQIANLSNWQLDGQEQGSSTPFVFPPNSLIAPNQFLVLTQQITKLVLNNNNDQVRLIYPDGSVATEISYYTEEKQGLSIAFNGSDYFWTKTPTPGSVNIISSTDLNNQNENISSNNPEPIIKETKEIPETLTNINLTQSKNLSVINPLTEPDNCLTDSCTIEQSPLIEEQTASLARTTQSSQKSKLILYISIIISASLIISWGLIRLRNRDKERP